MPIGDNSDYDSGHFSLVYEHLIKPACEKAGFQPIRADDILTTNHIALDIIKRIISSDMALCDLSSQNPNVLYELGIRQAFDKPVTLIKDKRTDRIFDIQGIRDLVYDETLRVDKVEGMIETLSDMIITTYENKDEEINSLVKLLGIKSAEITKTTEISTDTDLILNSLKNINNRLTTIEARSSNEEAETTIPSVLQYIQNSFDYQGERGKVLNTNELEKLSTGDKVFHDKFGVGQVIRIKKRSTGTIGDFLFNIGSKQLLLKTE